MLIVPVFSYLVGDYLAGQYFGIQFFPQEWYGTITVPPVLANFQGLSYIAGLLAMKQHLTATLVLALVTLLIVGGIVSIVYGYMYSMLSPSKYGPMDVPPPRVKTKKYKR
jgi:hypothetical protein